MRVCWQTTTSSPRSDAPGSVALPNNNIPSHNEVPSIPFDPSTVSSISAASIYHAIEVCDSLLMMKPSSTFLQTLRMAFPNSQRPSRHLILVAANTPLQDLSGTQTMHDIALTIFQVRDTFSHYLTKFSLISHFWGGAEQYEITYGT